jgi:hypothetical protein
MADAFGKGNLLFALLKNAPPSYSCDKIKAWKEAVAVLAIQVDCHWVAKLGQGILEAMRVGDFDALALKIQDFQLLCDATGGTIKTPVIKEMAKSIIDTTVKNASVPHHLLAIAKFVDKSTSLKLFDPNWYDEVVSGVIAIKFSDDHHEKGTLAALHVLRSLMWCAPLTLAVPSSKRPRESDGEEASAEAPEVKAAKVT